MVKDWDEVAYQQELKMREDCPICLYVITNLMTGVYSIAELIDDSNKHPRKTVFAVFREPTLATSMGFTPFDKHQLKSLDKVGQMVKTNGGVYLGMFGSPSQLGNSIIESVKHKL